MAGKGEVYVHSCEEAVGFYAKVGYVAREESEPCGPGEVEMVKRLSPVTGE
jgi:hypothetical protein